jgi:AcrR family transcriptional regulator
VSTSDERHYHRGDLRAALVTAALDLLGEAGAEAVSLRAVARRAGVSAMAPYRHYADKEALLAAVATLGFERFRDALRAADWAAPAGQGLVAQAVAYVGFAVENPALFRLMFGPKRFGAHPELWAAGEAAYGVLAGRVAAETPVEAEREARALGCWSLVHGLAMLLLDGRLGDKAAVSAEDVTRLVAEAMLGPGAGGRRRRH